MQKFRFLFVLLFGALMISACGSGTVEPLPPEEPRPSIEEGSCSGRIKIQYANTKVWWGNVNDQSADYASNDEKFSAYMGVSEFWQDLEPATTCDVKLIDLAKTLLSAGSIDEWNEELYNDFQDFNLDISHAEE